MSTINVTDQGLADVISHSLCACKEMCHLSELIHNSENGITLEDGRSEIKSKEIDSVEQLTTSIGWGNPYDQCQGQINR